MFLLAKIVIPILIVAALGFGWSRHQQTAVATEVATTASSTVSTDPTNGVKPNTDEISARDSSDASISADLQTIDSSISASASAAASVDDSFNDKPVPQGDK